jgi:hypothetical protein
MAEKMHSSSEEINGFVLVDAEEPATTQTTGHAQEHVQETNKPQTESSQATKQYPVMQLISKEAEYM